MDKEKNIGEKVLFGVIIIILVFVCLIASDLLLPLVNIEYIEGEIDSVSISQSSVLYNMDNDTSNIMGLPRDVLLHTPCRIYYGYGRITGAIRFKSIEYLEVEWKWIT